MRNLKYILSFGNIFRDVMIDGVIRRRCRHKLVEMTSSIWVCIGLLPNLLVVELRQIYRRWPSLTLNALLYRVSVLNLLMTVFYRRFLECLVLCYSTLLFYRFIMHLFCVCLSIYLNLIYIAHVLSFLLLISFQIQ